MGNFDSDKRAKRPFFTRPTLKVAKDLLGRHLIRKEEDKTFKGKIVETEAYIGPQDKAAHAYGGKKTDRNKIVFEQGGFVYIYLCYGIHWQLNFTTDKEKPECVLIRALEPITPDKGKEGLTDGPGKLTRWMKLDKDFYGEDLVKSERIWISKGKKLKRNQIVADSRIGIDYAEEWADKPWRFFIKGSSFVSRK